MSEEVDQIQARDSFNYFDPELLRLGKTQAFIDLEKNTTMTCSVCNFVKPNYDFALVIVKGVEGGMIATYRDQGVIVRRDEMCKPCRRKMIRMQQSKFLKVHKPKFTKRCLRCKELLPVTSFGKDVNRTGGLNSRCRECASVYAKEYREAHRGQQKIYQKVYKLRQMGFDPSALDPQVTASSENIDAFIRDYKGTHKPGEITFRGEPIPLEARRRSKSRPKIEAPLKPKANPEDADEFFTQEELDAFLSSQG